MQVAVCDPIRVLYIHPHATRLPLLDIIALLSIIALEVLFLVKVFSTWVEISSYNRIEVSPIGDHIVRIVTDIVSRDIQRQLIIEELRRITYRSVIAMVLIIRYDPLSINSRCREIGLVLISTNREVERVVERHPTVIEVTHLIVRRCSELITPRGILTRLITVGVLELRQNKWRSRLHGGGEVHSQLTSGTLLRINQDYPIRSTGTIESSCRRTCQDTD